MLNLLLFSIFLVCPNPFDLQSAVNPFYYLLTRDFINHAQGTKMILQLNLVFRLQLKGHNSGYV